MLEPPSSLLIGRLLASEYLTKSKESLKRRFELLAYAQVVLHNVLFPDEAESAAKARMRQLIHNDRDKEGDDSQDAKEAETNAGALYFYSLEMKLRMESTDKKSKDWI